MKKFWIIILAITAILTIAACSDGQQAFVPESPGSSSQNGENSSGNGSDSTTPDNNGNNGSNNGDNNGSGSEPDVNGDPQPLPAFTFTFRDVVIELGEDIDHVISKLGEPQGDFKGPSCAFEGLEDRIVQYDGVQFQAYPDGDRFKIFLIGVFSDGPLTSEGRIRLGASIQDVLAAYGDNFEYNTGAYTFTRGLTFLEFLTEDDSVYAINYRLDLGL
jgi:hypothetical protein